MPQDLPVGKEIRAQLKSLCWPAYLNPFQLTFEAFPRILFDRLQHVRCKLKAGRMRRSAAVMTGDHFLGCARFLVYLRIAQTEITVAARRRLLRFALIVGGVLVENRRDRWQAVEVGFCVVLIQ